MITPPQDIPDAKKLMEAKTGRSLQFSGSRASNLTSSGTRTVAPVDPERTERDAASTWVVTSSRFLMAAFRSTFSSEAVSIA